MDFNSSPGWQLEAIYFGHNLRIPLRVVQNISNNNTVVYDPLRPDPVDSFTCAKLLKFWQTSLASLALTTTFVQPVTRFYRLLLIP